ncbi:protein phosphatase 2C domain-containing protein [Shewanella sp. SM73]|uniref:PP2C family serine/threonine-protein phosphatase n=1 Tax=Shewanella sp. SM73 TaxID=2912806 RepID=UPI0021D8AF46|nr:PP2C family serine/threonine-protein phosphatase [Shewanella sp. SM73]MCU8032392.1 protein phosphatase 2C domain-containing protein [Shewanella sp. SM73]
MQNSPSLEKQIHTLIGDDLNHRAGANLKELIKQDKELRVHYKKLIELIKEFEIKCDEILRLNQLAQSRQNDDILQQGIAQAPLHHDTAIKDNHENNVVKQTEYLSESHDPQSTPKSGIQPDHVVVESKTDETSSSVPASSNCINFDYTNNSQKASNRPHPEKWERVQLEEYSNLNKSEGAKLPSASLVPGMVPPAPQLSKNQMKHLAAPQAKIEIPNARAREHFSSSVGISLDNGKQAKIIDVLFPRDIGLSYDSEQHLVIGIPTESGDFQIYVQWSCDLDEKYEDKALLIVNPDPRSLWKVLEPPSDAKYRKEHLKSAGLQSKDLRIAASSRRGRSHEHAGSFRDDDFYINFCNQTEWAIMLVADGAGSAVNSREGSRIAVLTAGEYLYEQLNGQKGITLKEHVTAWEVIDKQVVINAMLHHFKQAATLAVNSIQNEAIRAEEPVKSYSTTLLATISLKVGSELFAAAFWLGDGAIAAYSPSGKVRILGNPDSGEYAGQTRFLDQRIIDDSSFTGRISVGKWNDVAQLILMTDGVSDPYFETDNGLRSDEKWTRLVNELSPILVDVNIAPEKLGEWLNFFSAGNHDDRTIAVLW